MGQNSAPNASRCLLLLPGFKTEEGTEVKRNDGGLPHLFHSPACSPFSFYEPKARGAKTGGGTLCFRASVSPTDEPAQVLLTEDYCNFSPHDSKSEGDSPASRPIWMLANICSSQPVKPQSLNISFGNTSEGSHSAQDSFR